MVLFKITNGQSGDDIDGNIDRCIVSIEKSGNRQGQNSHIIANESFLIQSEVQNTRLLLCKVTDKIGFAVDGHMDMVRR